jgi:hypothetical protein
MSTFTSEPGARLADRYRLEDRVNAADGWAAWKAIDETLARPVTVLTFASDFPRVSQVLTAARAASRLTDSRLSQVFDVEDGDERAYIVMEWVAGDSLDDLLAGGPLDPEHGAALITEASKALAGAHAAGLAHLCLTPSSLRWTQGGGVKLVGLGIDAALADISAEDPALADTQGLGRLLYATLTGHWAGMESTSLPPAPMAEGLPCSPRQVRAGVPAAIDAVACEALFQRPRRDRPTLTTPALLAQALAEVTPSPGLAGARPVDRFVTNQTLSGTDRDGAFSWAAQAQASRGGQPGRTQPAPGQRAVTTSAVFAIVVVLVLAAIGVGGWLLSHHHSDSPVTHSHSSGSPAASSDTVLKAVGATASDNPAKASLAIDPSTTTDWYTEYYDNNPVFGGLKKGTGLVLDMGKQVKISQIQILFGPNAGANVQIKVSDSPPSPASAGSLPTVAQARGVSGAHTFSINGSATGRYVTVWITRLPPKIGNSSQYQAEIYNVVIRGAG